MPNNFPTIKSFINKAENMRLGVLLFLCVCLGGTSLYSIELKPILYVLSVISIAWCLSLPTRDIKNLLNVPAVIGTFLFSLFILYLIPLPAGLTEGLPFRDNIKQIDELVGLERPRLPLSLTPQTTYISLYDFLPPVAIAINILLAPRIEELTFAIKAFIAVLGLSVILAGMQLFLNDPALYFHSINGNSAKNYPAGFFGNPNHFAGLLIIALLFVIDRFLNQLDTYFKQSVLSFAPLIALTLGLLALLTLTNSVSAIMILCIALCLLITLRLGRKIFQKKILLLLLGGIAIVIFEFFIIGKNWVSTVSKITTIDSTNRTGLWSNIINSPEFPSIFGTGPGSFYETYLLISQSETFTNKYYNEAHNDFIQIVMELGLFGGVIILAFITWFIITFLKTIRGTGSFKKEKILALCCILVPLLHSATDYPLRTPAFMAVFTFLIFTVVRLDQMENEAS